MTLEKFVYIKRHFDNFSVVVLFDFLQELVISGGNEVNGNTLEEEELECGLEN